MNIEDMNLKLPLLLMTLLGVSSCLPSYEMSSIQVEMIKPSFLNHPEKIDTIAILYRKQSHSDTISYKYNRQFKLIRHIEERTDSAIHYNDLYRICVKALINNLDSTKYFVKVVNYSDSINNLGSNKCDLKNPWLFNKPGIDACIFLEPFKFNDFYSKGNNDWMIDIQCNFPEFTGSTELENINANLIWTAYLKGDTTAYKYEQFDDLYYGNSVYPDLFGTQKNHKLLVENTAEYFGKSFVSKLIPSWTRTDRSYYISKNIEMKKAEEFCKNGDWLKAAEIYRKYIRSKNMNISAKSKYNMALICEMEGNIDAAVDWLYKSKSDLKTTQIDHLINCNKYTKVLDKRKQELSLLDKQVRN
jgi:hypothetical protein